MSPDDALHWIFGSPTFAHGSGIFCEDDRLEDALAAR